MTSLMWFRDDLRLHDNQALSRAAEAAALGDAPLVAVVLDEPAYPGTRPLGGASTWWRERSLYALARDLAGRGVELIRAAGDAREEIPRLAAELGATTVTWTRRYHGPLREVDASVKETLTSQGTTATSLPGFTLVEPWEVTNGQGQPYKVFTPFSKAAASQVAGDEPEGVPEMGASASSASAWPQPTEPAWAASLAEHWTPGEAGARERLAQLQPSQLCRGARYPRAQCHLPTLAPPALWRSLPARGVVRRGRGARGRQVPLRAAVARLCLAPPLLPAQSRDRKRAGEIRPLRLVLG
ncbi:deoxyribodipyrimidine photo-lyase [Corynebacterium tuberculostearicum]